MVINFLLWNKYPFAGCVFNQRCSNFVLFEPEQFFPQFALKPVQIDLFRIRLCTRILENTIISVHPVLPNVKGKCVEYYIQTIIITSIRTLPGEKTALVIPTGKSEERERTDEPHCIVQRKIQIAQSPFPPRALRSPLLPPLIGPRIYCASKTSTPSDAVRNYSPERPETENQPRAVVRLGVA